MTDSSIARITGMFGVACVLLSWAQFPLWVIGGAPPFYDSEAWRGTCMTSRKARHDLRESRARRRL